MVGIGDRIQEAREISMLGISAVRGEGLRHRTDVASEEHIAKSVAHSQCLRGG